MNYFHERIPKFNESGVEGGRFLKINIMPVTRRVQRVRTYPLRLPKDPLDQQCPTEGVSSADERSVRARGSSACAYYDVANCVALSSIAQKRGVATLFMRPPRVRTVVVQRGVMPVSEGGVSPRVSCPAGQLTVSVAGPPLG